MIDWNDSYYHKCEFCKHRGPITYKLTDADLVIAERDKVIEEQENLIAILKKERDWLAKDRAQAYYDLEKKAQLNIKKEQSIRHQKYKRCLAMARWCEATALWCYQAANTLPTGFHATLFGKSVMIEPYRLYNRSGRLMKWSNRWLEFAKKFKE